MYICPTRVGRPIHQVGKRRVCIKRHQIVVHHASPRRLLVSLEPGHAKLFLPAVHAPHKGAESHIILSGRIASLIRPDFVAIPDRWWWGSVHSQVDVGIHAGQASPDHFAVLVEITARLQPISLGGSHRQEDIDSTPWPYLSPIISRCVCG